MCYGDDNVSNIIVDYYQTLFITSNPWEINYVLQFTPQVVTLDMNNMLLAKFTKIEVDITLKQMAPLKSPGPNSMPPIFYQHYWESIGDDVAKVVIFCLNLGVIPIELNHTYITFIPKVKSMEYMTKFRPIALCNILYKLILKVLVNCLKKILPKIIFESQSTFQANKDISDNILVAFETFHHIKKRTSCKTSFMTLKLDISKAYDRVRQVFLLQLMERMGFNRQWINLTSACISTMLYSILVNGELKGNIIPTRGIRQGDPLSPYLFSLCSEGLMGLIRQAVHEDKIRGFSLCKRGPKITYLLFADDSLCFCQAQIGDIQSIQSILER